MSRPGVRSHPILTDHGPWGILEWVPQDTRDRLALDLWTCLSLVDVPYITVISKSGGLVGENWLKDGEETAVTRASSENAKQNTALRGESRVVALRKRRNCMKM